MTQPQIRVVEHGDLMWFNDGDIARWRVGIFIGQIVMHEPGWRFVHIHNSGADVRIDLQPGDKDHPPVNVKCRCGEYGLGEFSVVTGETCPA